MQHTNRLARETSPYLRQHQHNPVDWYPWGAEALEHARRDDRPILLSIGYSACHWCHVMERESFENEEIAALMNGSFVNIKVDREERPDLDHIYMNAVQMMTGHGGWPLTVFLTPAGEPFYGGTYFPPDDRHNMPGFRRVLTSIAAAYRERPQDVRETVGKLIQGLQRLDAYQTSDEALVEQTVIHAAESLAQAYDSEHGGLGRAPKFPNESAFALFLRVHHATGERRFLDMATHTLRQMARGGMYDHLGGGFHRYSVDERWLVPHFEKMLYDNAQLVCLYLDTYQAAGDPFFAAVAGDILEYVRREMRHPEGGFYSSQDADSEGEEGKFFVWTPEEVREVLGDRDADLFCRYYDITDFGNFEGSNILHPTLEIEPLARLFGLDVEETRRRLEEARARLFERRERRVKPGLDDKVLTAWNALMIGAFARAAEVLGESRHLAVAREAADFVFRRLWQNGRLRSTFKDGEAKLNAYLDDHAFLASALLDLFEASQDAQHLRRAAEVTEVMIAHFWDDRGGGFYFTSDDHEELIVRSKPAFDGSIPSGNSVAASALLRLHFYTGEGRYMDLAEKLLRLFHAAMRQQPFGFANMLCALDFYVHGPHEIVLLGSLEEPAAQEIVSQLRRRYLPNRTLQIVDPRSASMPPMLAGKERVDGKPTVYVCSNRTCSPPATTWAELERLL